MEVNEILGFDPSQLSVFNTQDKESNKQQFNSNIYRPRPADIQGDDKTYCCTVKFVYNPFDLPHSVLERQTYGMTDKNGWFEVVSSLTINDTNCPIFKAWKKCHYAKKDENYDLWKQAAPEKDKDGNLIGGQNKFDKRFNRWATVQVLADAVHPELVGKFMLMRIPIDVWNVINTKMNPAAASGKASIPVMDFLFGRSVDLTITPGPGKPGELSFNRQTSWAAELSEDVVSCTYPDGSPLLNDAEQAVCDTYVAAMKKVWASKDGDARKVMLQAIDADPNTTEFRAIYARVMSDIKTFCPNLLEELNYKPWDEATTARVQAWIDIVLSGNDPKTFGDAPAVASAPVASAPVESAPVATPVFNPGSPTEDLPF